MQLWKRRLFVEVDNYTIPPILTTKFLVNFSEVPETDSGEVTIYNLSSDTLKKIKKNSVIRISAGYENDYGNIFYGQILDVATGWDNVDKVTTITLGDSNTNYRRMSYSRSFAPGTTNDEILRHLITRSGIGIGDFDTVVNPVYRNGLTVKGKLQTLITNHANIAKSRSYVNKSRIYIRPPRKSNTTSFLLDKNSGLVDAPEQFEKEENEKKYIGFSVKSLLNHQLNVDQVIQIKSRTANGYFRVSSGKHEGGNYENEYYTTMEVYPI